MNNPRVDELAFLSMQSASALLESKRISPLELTQACLHRIEALNPVLNAFITVTADAALQAAKTAEQDILRGRRRGPLHGIPVALKDNIDTAGTRTTAASALFKDRVPKRDAAVVERLDRAGVIFLGKLNMQEFAYGGTSVPSHFGPTLNPWNTKCIAGGSSGGSGAAVAAGLCFGALGTDTGGSIREPAALCGVAGLKGTYGRVSTRGVIPLASSLDHVGPLARSALDCGLMLDAIAGYDPYDVTSADRSPDLEAISPNLKGLRLGLPRDFFYADVDPEILTAIDRAVAVLAALGAEICDIPLEVSQNFAVFRAEAFAHHAQDIAKTPNLYLAETLAKLSLGARIDTAAYIGARHQMAKSRRAMNELFSTIDALVTPTVPVTAPRLSHYPATLEGVFLLEGSSILRNTRPFNVFGIPAISIPCGFAADGLPIGLHIAGPPWRERRVLSLAHAYQSVTDWHTRVPALSG